MKTFTATATIGTRELPITYDGGDEVTVTCVCGESLSMGTTDGRCCSTCGAYWDTRLDIHVIEPAPGDIQTRFRVYVMENDREVALLTNDETMGGQP